jgi:hypothetical protein
VHLLGVHVILPPLAIGGNEGTILELIEPADGDLFRPMRLTYHHKADA